MSPKSPKKPPQKAPQYCRDFYRRVLGHLFDICLTFVWPVFGRLFCCFLVAFWHAFWLLFGHFLVEKRTRKKGRRHHSNLSDSHRPKSPVLNIFWIIFHCFMHYIACLVSRMAATGSQFRFLEVSKNRNFSGSNLGHFQSQNTCNLPKMMHAHHVLPTKVIEWFIYVQNCLKTTKLVSILIEFGRFEAILDIN